MTTLTEVLNTLKERGIEQEFAWAEDGLKSEENKVYKPEELLLIRVYRFEENTNPSDMSILYVLKAKDGTLGYSLNAYGVYSNQDAEYDNFMRLVPEAGNDEQLRFTL
ncbi:MAG: hypothetical protein J0I41_03440 [Filimonas sp.]|nr:hypothetical protein [Filimonas sp.]